MNFHRRHRSPELSCKICDSVSKKEAKKEKQQKGSPLHVKTSRLREALEMKSELKVTRRIFSGHVLSRQSFAIDEISVIPTGYKRVLLA